MIVIFDMLINMEMIIITEYVISVFPEKENNTVYFTHVYF